jgi:D-alanyl-D-alanine dipeptidase
MATNPLELKFAEYGLVNINTLDEGIRVDLKYSTTDNFVGEDMYGALSTAWLVPDVADRVVCVQHRLRARRPGYSLVIYDAARSISIQRRMFALVAGTDKARYVANPDRRGGGYHNYGLAVDLSIIDDKRQLLDMGSPFDWFGPESHTGSEKQLVAEGLITPEALDNRTLLYGLMASEGMTPHPDEWWHFQPFYDQVRKRTYRLLDF